MTDCPFCDILSGSASSSVIFQDSRCTVFMDINPINPGHMLVIPNYHAPSLSELDENTSAYLFKVSQKMVAALKKSGLKSEGVNIFLADGEAAGQDVFHFHLHVIPRFENDGVRIIGYDQGTQPGRDELERIAQVIKNALSPRVYVYHSPSPHTGERDVRQQIRRQINPELYTKIRRLWTEHSIAEDQRDIAGLMATLTPNCVYTLVNKGVTWEGHEGATRFYTELLTAFPDIKFYLQNIVIGPQGVVEEAHVTATHKNQWLDFPATGEEIEFDVIIFFPWDPSQELFTGERIFMFLPD